MSGVAPWFAAALGFSTLGFLARRRRVHQRWRRLLNPTPSQRTRLSQAAPISRGLSLMDGRWTILIACAASVAGFALDGPVAGLALGVYGLAGARWLRRTASRNAAGRSRKRAADAVAALAAEMRAGQPVAAALANATGWFSPSTIVGDGAATVSRRLAAAVEVAEASGAPLADVLDRLDNHVRATDRARASAQAQAAGSQASAFLLGVMPVAGAGLGFLIGIDPWRVLLHSRLGIACLAGAMALQLAGLAWSGRLARVEVAG